MTRWQFSIDRGGTFTDVVARRPDGGLIVRKVLSVQPGLEGDPAVDAIQALMATEGLGSPSGIEELRLGTTVATNALLEGKGEPVLLLTNKGLADLLRIGDQHRRDLFALEIPPSPSLIAAVEGVSGRLDAAGRELEPLVIDAALISRLQAHRAAGLRSCAIALMHAWRTPAHERALAEAVLAAGFETVIGSHQVSPLPRLVPRGQTTLVEAAVRPVLQTYLNQVQAALQGRPRLRVMTSSGGLQAPTSLLAKDTILSGPAGGMVGAVAAAQQAGVGHLPLVGVDMGGTSTDVFCLPAGAADRDWDRSPETEIAGLLLTASRLPIHTVAAGGGSIIHDDGGRVLVGPRSAGADPGPACYGRGGPLTITDAHLLLGRLQAQAFPALFGPNRDAHPNLAITQNKFAVLAESLQRTPEVLAEGALDLAVEAMAAAIRQVSLFRGHDIRGGVLVAYGGAAGQLACRVATALGLRQVLLHPLAGVLSAYGIGQARPRQLRQSAVRERLDGACLTRLPALVAEQLALAHAALKQVCGRSVVVGEQRVHLELRDGAAEQGLLIALEPPPQQPSLENLRAAFAQAHQQRFGYAPAPDTRLVVERIDVEVLAAAELSAQGQDECLGPAGTLASVPDAAMVHWPQRGWCAVPVVQRLQLSVNQRLEGPALILDPTAGTVLEPGWSARRLPNGSLSLEMDGALPGGAAMPAAASREPCPPQSPDPVDLSLFHHRFMQIAERMGERLRQTSRSVNIRERLDFSCALFDGEGALVANAPHIPVHLGSMGDAVADLLLQVRRGDRPALRDGDTIISNDPFHGGTHLPDITAITPVFSDWLDAPFAFVACRGHHADVGGLTPGSMPPFSRRISEEGLLVRNWWLVQQGVLNQDGWAELVRQQPFPLRAPDLLWADLQAQVAANHLGLQLFQTLLQVEGRARVGRYLQHVQDHAASTVRRLIDRLQERHCEVQLDNGAWLRLALRVQRHRREAVLDFSGSSLQGDHNFHAPLAVTKAAVLYVLRCLVEEPIPLNAGCFQPLTLVVPEGCLLNPRPPAAVVAGNVETSQALCNLLFAAVGAMAAAQGTMNNLTFGDGRRQYYETIAGGGGAGPGFPGSCGVQTHMTNSRLTDPEILEQRFPVRLERFGFRPGSGGAGRWPGGDGLVREFRFLEPMTAALLSGSRLVAPFGLEGGEDGAPGAARLTRATGSCEPLQGCAQLEVQPGDRLLIATPGGGGWGVATTASAP